MIARDGSVVTDATLPECIEVTAQSAGDTSQPCVQRVIQIAETSADRQGGFELLLPSNFETLD
jgi:hypothetical protein